MSSDLHDRAGRLLVEAIRRPADEREAWLRDACGDDSALVDAVRSLLAHHERPGVDLDRPVRDEAVHPARIGPYRILGVLGRGGMGVVYRAEQTSPRRIVALKVLRPGIVGRAALRRFELEAAVLARLHHPGIAPIYEAGTDDPGNGEEPRPWFAMELVEGRPIDRYADEERLDLRRRLELLARVCDAVQHAHAQGVIHRDLKPANILVEADGRPRILDFGVARTTDSDVRTTTLRTDVGQFVGTLASMSPEQCAGDPAAIGVASDVYALGVLGYELLAGRLPHDFTDLMIHDVVRIIREDDPPPVGSVDRRLRGDVETILGTALQKDPRRRYPSAAALAEDVRRHLGHEPIVARPPSAIYQLRKFTRRHRALVGGAAAVFAALVVGLVVALALLARSQEAETRARAAADDAVAVGAFLGDLITIANPYAESGDRDMTVRDMLDRAAQEVGPRFADRPLVEAEIRLRIGLACGALGLGESAIEHLARAAELRRRELGADDAGAIEVSVRLSEALVSVGRLDEAAMRAESDLDRAERLLGATSPVAIDALRAVARLRHAQVRREEAIALQRRAIERSDRRYGPTAIEALVPRIDLAAFLTEASRYAEARALLEATRPALQARVGAAHPRALDLERRLVEVLTLQALYEDATEASRSLVAALESGLGPGHPDTIRAAVSLARLHRLAGRLEEAERRDRAAIAAAEAAERVDPDVLLTAMNGLAITLEARGRPDESATLLEEIVARRIALSGPRHPATLAARANLANALNALGRFDEAESILRPLVADYREVLGDHPQTMSVVNNLASVLYRRGDLAAAEPLFRDVVEHQRADPASDPHGRLDTIQNLARTLTRLGRAEEAAPLYAELMAEAERQLPAEHLSRAIYGVSHALCLIELARFEEAEALLAAWVPRLCDVLGDAHRFSRLGMTRLAETLEALDRPDEAASWRARLAAPE